MGASDDAKAIYAHSVEGRPIAQWELLEDHLSAVQTRAAAFADAFGWGALAGMAGCLHDIGKSSAQFQAYITRNGEVGGDHSTAGAREAVAAYASLPGRILAFVIAGHHAGLANAEDLDRRLRPTHAIPDYRDWLTLGLDLPPIAKIYPSPPWKMPRTTAVPGFLAAFLTRMIFSCLVDADFLETERFLAHAQGKTVARGGHTELTSLRDRLRIAMAQKCQAAPSVLNDLRREILDHVKARATDVPGLFTLTVPTGGGKTLASLSFALEHAVQHGLHRVIYVIPFTSIIEQTAAVFRAALGTEADVLEHHATVDWSRESTRSQDDDNEGPDGSAKLRRAAENWDVPVVVTTAVQFFESLFANRTSRCRKLHNLAGAVIVLDEAQTLPLPLLRPCMVALEELAARYGASIVLCTATQPALREKDGFKGGFTIDDTRELAPDPPRLYAALRRVRVERLAEPLADPEIAARFEAQPRMLCIVNSRAHAHALHAAIAHLPGAAHLTTLMCPRHRRKVLSHLRSRLEHPNAPVRLVATSLIEAGVDIDFPEVWRAEAGLDAIAQAAGRCNREGRLSTGRVVVFTPAEAKPPRAMAVFAQAAATVMARHEDPLSLDAIQDYFAQVYWQKGPAALDAAEVGTTRGILRAIAERAEGQSYPFADIADAFRMIEEEMVSIVVPWRADPDDRKCEAMLNKIAAMDSPLAADLRQLQQYMVPIPRARRDDWLARGVLTVVSRNLGADLLKLESLAHYSDVVGLDIGSANLRSAESNIL